MEFRNPYETETEQLKQIWKLCFGDSEEYIRFYFNHGYAKDQTIVCADGNKILSMLSLLPAKITDGTDIYLGGYIYAAATLPEFQGHGLMKKLEQVCSELAFSNDAEFLSLVPADASLFQMYQKLGYEISGSLCEKTYRITEAARARQVKISALSQEGLKAERKIFLEKIGKYLELEEELESYWLKELEMTGCKFAYASCGEETGYFIYYIENGHAYIRELGMDKHLFDQIISTLAAELKASVIHIRAYEDFGSDWEVKPFSMIKPKASDKDFSKCYANLMLD